VKNKPKKASVKKSKGEIEVSLGDGQVTKYDIMTAIAKKYTIYEATVWLNNPIEGKTKKTPAELMIDGEFKLVQKLINDSDDELSV
tara:strand:+ start:13185 stop:13442 length:258 start_codon:yes stop_codon:yes gene_type:complete